MGFNPPKSYELRRDGVVLAIAQENRGTHTWFWYGGGVNTAGHPCPLENVKKEAAQHFRSRTP